MKTWRGRPSSAPARWRHARRRWPRRARACRRRRPTWAAARRTSFGCGPSARRWRSSAATCGWWPRPRRWWPAATPKAAARRWRAPAAALVPSRDAEGGSGVVAGQAVLRLVDPASLWVKLRVDQGRSAGLAPGLAARIVLRSRPGEALAGRVVRVEPLADSVTEERLAMVAFDALPAGVSVGEMAEVTLALPATPEGLLLPNAALQQHEGTTGVWRLADGGLRFVPVVTGVQGLDGTVQVKAAQDAGLAEGDTVVLYSQKALQPDARISVVEQLAPLAGAVK